MRKGYWITLVNNCSGELDSVFFDLAGFAPNGRETMIDEWLTIAVRSAVSKWNFSVGDRIEITEGESER